MVTSTSHRALDGGWGYIVAVGVFFVSFLLDGLESSFGVILPSLKAEFNCEMSVLTLTGGLITGVCLGIGPITAILVNKFGCRRVAFIGGIIASTSLAACTVVQSIELFIVCYGVSAGIGIGLLYLPSITTINTYFDKKRAIVVGVATSGSGVGLLVMAIVIDLLIREYGWRGCYLILSGIYLNLCVCAALMRPLEDNYKNKEINSCKDTTQSWGNEDTFFQIRDTSCNECTNQRYQNGGKNCMALCHNENSIDKSNNIYRKCDINGAVNYNSHAQQNVLNNDNYDDAKFKHENDDETRTTRNSRSQSLNQYDLSCNEYDALNSHELLDNTGVTSSQLLYTPAECVSRSHISLTTFDSRSLQSLKERDPSLRVHTSSISIDIKTQEASKISQMSLFKIIRFDLFCIGAFLIQVASVIPPMFVPSFSLSHGLDQSSAAMIVSVLGISNTVGRLVAGFLAYLGIGSLMIYNVGTFMAGVACFFLPLCTTYPLLLVFAVTHGFFIGAFPPLQSVILVEQLGLQLLPASFGIMCLSKSIASVVGPTVAGALYEAAGTYSVPFYCTGAVFTLSTLIHGVMSLCPKHSTSS